MAWFFLFVHQHPVAAVVGSALLGGAAVFLWIGWCFMEAFSHW